MKSYLTKALPLAALAACTAAPPGAAQTNAGNIAPEVSVPFALKQVASFDNPFRIAFLPDGRMLVTERPGKLWLVTQDGAKTEVTGVPPVVFALQSGLLGVYLSPGYARDGNIYLTYAEPGENGAGGLALAKAKLAIGADGASLDGLKVIWRQLPRGKGGQYGGAVTFSPDGKFLYLTVGDRMRFDVAQDPDQSLGKILRLTLDGKPAPGNPNAGKTGAASVPLVDPPRDTEASKTNPVVSTYTFEGPNLAPSEIWATGFRTPYGLAFSPDGRLWELEHGPRGGDELNLIEPGKNYGWPLVSYATNYNGVPIPSPDTRADLEKPVIYWTPVIAPGNFAFYTGDLFPEWKGSAFVAGMGTQSLSRITFDGKGGATPAERWKLNFRVRDVAQAPDGALWILADGKDVGLYRLTPN